MMRHTMKSKTKFYIKGVIIMNKSKFKKVLISLSLSATMAIPTATVFGSALTASAAAKPFIADTDWDGAYNIDESQITVSSSRYYPAGQNIATTTTNTEDGLGVPVTPGSFASNTKVTSLPMLERATLTFDVKGTNLEKSDLNGFKLNLTYYLEDRKDYITYDNPKIITIDENNHEYQLKYDIITFGTSFEFTTSALPNVKRFRCTNAYMSPQENADNFYKIEVKTPGGENLFISIKNDGEITNANMEKWAKRLCMYVNSLSQTTGIKLGTVYMCFDHPVTPGMSAFSANGQVNSICDKFGYVGFDLGTTAEERKHIATGENEITWSVLHEVAHTYGVYVTPSTFLDKYGFADDFFTNIRGITALQNCDNLHDTKVYYKDDFSGEVSETYDNVLKEIDKSTPYHYYKFAYKLQQLGWPVMEKFFAAEDDNDNNFKDSKEAAEKLNSYTGINLRISSDNIKAESYLRMANVFRKLMKLSWGYYNKDNYLVFVDQKFGKELVTEIVQFLVDIGFFEQPIK